MHNQAEQQAPPIQRLRIRYAKQKTGLEPGASGWRVFAPWAPFATLVLGLVVMFAAEVHFARTLWFFGDDWDFLAERDLSVGDLLRPHNEHWCTIPIVLFRMMYGLFGIGSYLPYALLPIAAHVVVVGGLYGALRRSGIDSWAATSGALMMAFVAGGAGAENTLWDFQIAFVGSAAFGVVALWTAQDRSPLSRVFTVVLLVLSLMCSGMGLIMVAWVCLLVLFRDGVRDSVLVGAVPAATYGVWYLTYGHQDSVALGAGVGAVFDAALNGMLNMWSTALGVKGVGAVVLLALFVAAVAPRRSPHAAAFALSGLATLPVMYLVVANSRAALGLHAMQASRYVYFGVLLSAGAFAFGVESVSRRLADSPGSVLWWRTVALLAIGALGLVQLQQYHTEREQIVAGGRGRMAATLQLAARGERVISQSPDLVIGWKPELRHLLAVGLDRELRGVRPSEKDMISAQSAAQVAVSASDPELPPASTIGWYGFSDTPDGLHLLKGCRSGKATLGAYLVLPPALAGGQVVVTPSGDLVQTLLARGDLTSHVASWPVEPHHRLWIGTSAAQTALHVHLMPGRVTVCPADASSGNS